MLIALIEAAQIEAERNGIREDEGSFLSKRDHAVVSQLKSHGSNLLKMTRQYIKQLPQGAFYDPDHVAALGEDLATIMNENGVIQWLIMQADNDDGLYDRFSKEDVNAILAKTPLEKHYFIQTQKQITKIDQAQLPGGFEYTNLVNLCTAEIKRKADQRYENDFYHHLAWCCLYIKAFLFEDVDWAIYWHGKGDQYRKSNVLEGYGLPPKTSKMPSEFTEQLQKIKSSRFDEEIRQRKNRAAEVE